MVLATVDLFPPDESRAKSAVRLLVAAAMTAVGVLHFTHQADFEAIVPDYLPAHALLVQISGACEIAGGLGLLVAPVRRAAAWGLVLLYLAVFPANVNMAIHHLSLGGTEVSPFALWARLPFQVLFIAVAVWLARGAEAGR